MNLSVSWSISSYDYLKYFLPSMPNYVYEANISTIMQNNISNYMQHERIPREVSRE